MSSTMKSQSEQMVNESVLASWRVEQMELRTADMVGEQFPLVFWRGRGRIVASDQTGLSLLVRGLRAVYTWERLELTWKRLVANHTLSVDELGGGHDAVGIISIFAFMQGESLEVLDHDGLLVLKRPSDTPVHQYANMNRPSSWAPWRRKIHGN
jgi:hypothetical protein